MKTTHSQLSAESAIDSLAKRSPEEAYMGTVDDMLSAICRHHETMERARLVDVERVDIDDERLPVYLARYSDGTEQQSITAHFPEVL